MWKARKEMATMEKVAHSPLKRLNTESEEEVGEDERLRKNYEKKRERGGRKEGERDRGESNSKLGKEDSRGRRTEDRKRK
ncbi:hypothetical protein Q8A73_002860 [Channa argus]|nr:hypothetical protein Q8A73_002860 [Channa argus]